MKRYEVHPAPAPGRFVVWDKETQTNAVAWYYGCEEYAQNAAREMNEERK